MRPFETLRELGTDKIRVRFGRRGAYANVYMHWAWEDDMGYKKGQDYIEGAHSKKKFYFCEICGGLQLVRFVVPYDGSRPPGHYCYRCRKKNSIMDIKDATRYNKVL